MHFIESNANDVEQCDDWTGNVTGVCERIKNGHRFEKAKLTEPIEKTRDLNASFTCYLLIACKKQQ